MRMMIAAALTAAYLFTAPAGAVAQQGMAVAPPLAPGEVLLEVNGLGAVRSPATSATVTATARCEGTTEAEARRAHEAEVQRITAAARAAGATSADIHVSPTVTGKLGSEFALEIAAPQPAGEEAEPAQERHWARSTVRIRLRDASRAAALHHAIGEQDVLGLGGTGPVYELDDDSAARRGARAQAVAAARADAEAYAAAVNMRIVRMLRVTERAGLDFLGMVVSESDMARRMSWANAAAADAQVDTYAVVGIDFVMAPR